MQTVSGINVAVMRSFDVSLLLGPEQAVEQIVEFPEIWDDTF